MFHVKHWRNRNKKYKSKKDVIEMFYVKHKYDKKMRIVRTQNRIANVSRETF